MSIIPDVAQVDSLLAGDNQTGVQIDRFSGSAAGGWKVLKIGITAAQTLLTLKRSDCVIEGKHRRIQWMVLVPPGVTDYEVTIARWLTTQSTDKTKGLVFDRVIEDSVQAGLLTKDFLDYQRNERDPVCLLISAITGVASGPPPGVARPNNPAAIPNGFIVLWRPATRE